MRHKVPLVPLPRFLAGVGAIAAWTLICVRLARSSPAAALAAGPLAALPLCSLGEWLVHGFLYHGHVPGARRIRLIHHAGHHGALFPPRRYVQAGPFAYMRLRGSLRPFRMADNAVDDRLTRWSQVALHLAVGIPLVLVPSALLVPGPCFVGTAALTLAAVSWLLAHVHGAIHTPRDRWIERRAWFRRLDYHHYIHHVDLRANLNFGLPLCDALFGTLRLRLSAEEAARHPSFEEAKAAVRRAAAA